MKPLTGSLILLVLLAAVTVVLAVQHTEHGGKPLTTKLTGAAEVPGPGDADGAGTFSVNAKSTDRIRSAMSWPYQTLPRRLPLIFTPGPPAWQVQCLSRSRRRRMDRSKSVWNWIVRRSSSSFRSLGITM